MFVLNLINLIYKIQYIIYILILINAVLSWFPPMNNSFTKAVYSVTEPMLKPFRNLLNNFIRLPIDLSPLLLLFFINIIVKVLVKFIVVLFIY